jgi:hypothetical protein
MVTLCPVILAWMTGSGAYQSVVADQAWQWWHHQVSSIVSASSAQCHGRLSPGGATAARP